MKHMRSVSTAHRSANPGRLPSVFFVVLTMLMVFATQARATGQSIARGPQPAGQSLTDAIDWTIENVDVSKSIYEFCRKRLMRRLFPCQKSKAYQKFLLII